MQLYTLDPLLDPRWDALVASHPDASAFHTKGWLSALAKTYGYRPVVLTGAAPDKKLLDGIVFCEVRSWLTGPRLVSLPFSDHAQPLLTNGENAAQLQEWFQVARSRDGWKYVELRPISWEMTQGSTLQPGHEFWFHTLDLTPSAERLFANLHKNCFQRRIRRAEREQLIYERSSYDKLLPDFYKLLMITRRRHHILPQPKEWFHNLLAEMGSSAEIRVVRKDDTPIAALLSLRHRGKVIYKYGCSDDRLHNLAGMPFLFWKLIEESKVEGAEQIDFGRTDFDNEGLIEFKDRLGTIRTKLTYLRYPKSEGASWLQSPHLAKAKALFAALPDAVVQSMGSLVYRHVA
jgi:CelD/BcsL family acetyltransferase involved in cellulose biosynthesis